MIFNSKTRNRRSCINGKRIGLIGLGPRCGTTHIAVAISNYLSETEKNKVFLLEKNRNGDLIRLNELLGSKEPDAPFTHHRVTYIPLVSGRYGNHAPDIDGEFVVSDFGYDFKNGLEQLRLCDIRIIVGTDALWRKYEYEKLFETGHKRCFSSGWRLFVNLGDIRRMKEKDIFGMEVCCFPFEPNPLYPGKETINFLREAIYQG